MKIAAPLSMKRSSFRTVPLSSALLISCLLMSCGGTATTNGNDDNSPGDGDGDVTPGDGDSNPGDGDGDGDVDPNPDECAEFNDDPPGHLDVLIRNERTEAIYLGPRDPTCGNPPLFSVSDAQGNELTAHAEMCSSSCEQLLKGESFGCPDICLYPEIIRLDPGEAHPGAWDTRVFESHLLAEGDECVSSELAGATCPQGQRIEPGTFRFAASAGTEVSCDSAPEDECIERNVSGEVLSAEVEVRLDASYGIYENAPDSGGASEPAPGPINGIEIIFRD